MGSKLATGGPAEAETERRQKLEGELASMEEEKADFIATCASLREKLDTEQYTLEFLRQECDSREQVCPTLSHFALQHLARCGPRLSTL